MQMQMINRLAAFLAIVNNHTEAVWALLLGDLARHIHQMAYQLLLVLPCPRQLGQPVMGLGNDLHREGALMTTEHRYNMKMGALGPTRKCTGACGWTSRKARH